MRVKHGRPRVHESDAEKMKAYRKRNALVSFTVQLKQDIYDGLEAYRRFKDVSKSEVIERLIKTQLLRRR